MLSDTRLLQVAMPTWVQTLRRHFLKWSVQRPILSMSVVVMGCVALLPLVTAATLMPLALLLTYSGILASQGIFYVIYNILIQGLLLAMVIVALFIAGFAIATSASVFHSYRIFKMPLGFKKKN